jgi:hypothetical protein
MEEEKPKIFLIGSSHAKRIGFQMKELGEIRLKSKRFESPTFKRY